MSVSRSRFHRESPQTNGVEPSSADHRDPARHLASARRTRTEWFEKVKRRVSFCHRIFSQSIQSINLFGDREQLEIIKWK